MNHASRRHPSIPSSHDNVLTAVSTPARLDFGSARLSSSWPSAHQGPHGDVLTSVRTSCGRIANRGWPIVRVKTICVALAVVVVVLCTASAAPAEGTYAGETRISHLDAAIAGMTAMGDAGRRAFDIAIYDAMRARCKPGNRAAPTACLIATARDVCAGKATAKEATVIAAARDAIAKAGDRCLAVADVVITNQHSEKSMLDETTRMRLVRESADYHLAVIAAMEARWAVLASELALISPSGSLAARIDQLCRQRDREVRPCSTADANGTAANSGGKPACVGTIAYQRCAAGLVWFTSGPRTKL